MAMISGGGGGMPIIVLSQNIKRESGAKVQLGNIQAAKTIADVIRTCLGPKAMLKMLMDPMGGIVMTNDGNAILREIQVKHPAAKSMIEISRTQDEEVGDGTTSVIILGKFKSYWKLRLLLLLISLANGKHHACGRNLGINARSLGLSN